MNSTFLKASSSGGSSSSNDYGDHDGEGMRAVQNLNPIDQFLFFLQDKNFVVKQEFIDTSIQDIFENPTFNPTELKNYALKIDSISSILTGKNFHKSAFELKIFSEQINYIEKIVTMVLTGSHSLLNIDRKSIFNKINNTKIKKIFENANFNRNQKKKYTKNFDPLFENIFKFFFKEIKVNLNGQDIFDHLMYGPTQETYLSPEKITAKGIGFSKLFSSICFNALGKKDISGFCGYLYNQVSSFSGKGGLFQNSLEHRNYFDLFKLYAPLLNKKAPEDTKLNYTIGHTLSGIGGDHSKENLEYYLKFIDSNAAKTIASNAAIVQNNAAIVQNNALIIKDYIYHEALIQNNMFHEGIKKGVRKLGGVSLNDFILDYSKSIGFPIKDINSPEQAIDFISSLNEEQVYYFSDSISRGFAADLYLSYFYFGIILEKNDITIPGDDVTGHPNYWHQRTVNQYILDNKIANPIFNYSNEYIQKYQKYSSLEHILDTLCSQKGWIESTKNKSPQAQKFHKIKLILDLLMMHPDKISHVMTKKDFNLIRSVKSIYPMTQNSRDFTAKEQSFLKPFVEFFNFAEQFKGIENPFDGKKEPFYANLMGAILDSRPMDDPVLETGSNPFNTDLTASSSMITPVVLTSKNPDRSFVESTDSSSSFSPIAEEKRLSNEQQEQLENISTGFQSILSEDKELKKKIKKAAIELKEQKKRAKNKDKVLSLQGEVAQSKTYTIKEITFSPRVGDHDKSNLTDSFNMFQSSDSSSGQEQNKMIKFLEGLQHNDNGSHAETLPLYYSSHAITGVKVQSRRIDKENRFVFQFDKKNQRVHVLEVDTHYKGERK